MKFKEFKMLQLFADDPGAGGAPGTGGGTDAGPVATIRTTMMQTMEGLMTMTIRMMMRRNIPSRK